MLGLLFFILGLFTLPHYGINWDTINHLPRGQAYFHYFLTGNKDYGNLPEWNIYWQDPDSFFIDTTAPKDEVRKRSFYQSVGMPFYWMIENEGGADKGGHPPLSDIFAAAFNYVFFQQLGLVNDIDAYRIYGVLLAAILVGIVYYWISKRYGVFAGVIAAFSLALYPLFWSESHFNNEKDIPETVFISLMIFFFWQGVVQEKWRKILLSGLFFGLAVGTKFNVLFVPFIILPWLVIFWWGRWFLGKRALLFSMVAGLILGVSIFVASWPYLWSNPVDKTMKVVGFYKGIGLTKRIEKDYIGPFKTNTYPIQWIAYTTPPAVLFLALVGILSLPFRLRQEKDKLSLLLLLWLIVPILRVTAPGMTIYGGIRQIMEYIPPLAMLSGLGAATLFRLRPQKLYKIAVVVLVGVSFLLFAVRLASIHPNENVYFNFLIGGLKGAQERNIPSWGNSFGAAYRQGISWINKNAEPNSKVVLAHGLMPNIPKIWLRTDLSFTNAHRSGYLRQGEYALALVYEGSEERSYYDAYLNKFIKPSFEAKVDDVAVVRVWKNDKEHLASPLNEIIFESAKIEKIDAGLRFDLGETKQLSRLEIEYEEDSCQALREGSVRTSINGKDWAEIPETLPQAWRVAVLGQQPKEGKFIEPFAGQEARYVDLRLSPVDTCLKKVINYRMFVFE